MKTILPAPVFCAVSIVLASAPLRLEAGQLPNPTVTASATPFNASYTATNLFDDGLAEYASQSQGVVSAPFTTNPSDGTWVQLDFNTPVTFDQFVMAARRNTVDVVGQSRLIVSADPVFDHTDTIFTFEPSGANGSGLLRNLGPVSGRYARWEVITRTGTGVNLGGSQMYFLNGPSGHTRLSAPSVINAYPAFDANYAAAFAVNGDAGYENGTEYATAGGGAAMFIDFDFGAGVAISGFDYWNRWADRVTTFDLVFADTSDFSSPAATLSFTADANGNQVTSDTFAPVSARYVRFKATGYVNGANTGVREIQFYTPAGQPPIITQSPQSAVRLVGDPVTFTVGASGESLVLQWWKDTSTIDGATNASLTLTNLQLSDSGAYSVVVSNAYGSVTSTPPAVLTVTNPPVDIASNLRLWFKLDETSNLVAIDESGNANDGTLQGFVGDDSQWVAGRIDNGLRFDPAGGGTNEAVVVPDSLGQFDFATSSEFTLAAWVKGAPIQENSAGVIAKGGGGGGEQYAIDIFNGTFRFLGRGPGGTLFIASAAIGPNGAWQHVAGAYSRTLNRVKLYVNAVEVASAAPLAGHLLASTHEVSLGARQVSTNDYDLNFRGVMDDVRIYGRALTPADLVEIYSQAPALAPMIVQQPQGFFAPIGGAWTFSVAVDGSTPLFHQWSKGGTPIPDATNATYAVTNAQVSDTGDYSVRATNAHGAASSDRARLTVVPSLDLSAAPVQASSQWPDGNYPPARAFDGLRFSTGPQTARWASAGQGTPQWLYVDLGQDMHLKHVLLDWEFAAGRDMKLRVRTDAEGPAANPEDWRDVASVAGYVPVGNGLDGADMVFAFLPPQAVLQGNTAPSPVTSIQSNGVTARYVMVHALALTAPHQHFSLWEMQVDAVPPLYLLPPAITETGAVVAFTGGIPDQNYGIERALEISGPWTNIANVAASPGLTGFTDTNAPSGRAFYRAVHP